MKILLSAYTGLGNFVLKTPMLKKIKKLYPIVSIDIIAGNSFGTEYLLTDSTLIDKTHILPIKASIREKMKFFWQLREEQYDIVFLPFDAAPNFLLLGSYLAGIKQRVKHIRLAYTWWKRFGNIRRMLCYPATIFVPILPNHHEIDVNYDLLSAVFQRPYQRTYDTFIAPTINTTCLQKFDVVQKSYIVIQAGAANGQYKVKTWPTDRFISLIKQLLLAYPTLPILLVGDKGDFVSSVAPILEAFPTEKRLVNTAGLTTISEVVTLLKNATLIICHDSGIAHIADALKKEAIILFGPTDYTRVSPLQPTSHLLFSKTPYFAKAFYFATDETELATQGIGHKAMEGITVKEVLQKVKQIIDE